MATENIRLECSASVSICRYRGSKIYRGSKACGKRVAFGKVITGMEVVDKIYGLYGEKSNNQDQIESQGNAYLTKNFPKLDYIKTAKVVGGKP